MVIPDTQQAFTPAKPGNLPHLFLGQIQLILNESGLLFLHLHNQLDPAGIKNAFSVAAALQTEQVLHSLRTCHHNPA